MAVKAKESPLSVYLKEAFGRHPALPISIKERMQEQPTKKAAQRVLRNYLSESAGRGE